jgi:hypothetical protein
MCELPHTSLVVQKMHRARERSKVDKDIPESAATHAVNLSHAQPATEEPGVLRAVTLGGVIHVLGTVTAHGPQWLSDPSNKSLAQINKYPA